MKLKSKKATMEWPSFLISSIFSMLLFIIGVFMILNVANAGKIDIDPKLDALNYGLLASRVLNSADCLAWEEKTPDGYLVHAGIIDDSKFSSNRIKDCISGKTFVLAIYNPSDNTCDVDAEDALCGVTLISNHGGVVSLTKNKLTVGNNIIDKLKYDWFAAKVVYAPRDMRSRLLMVAIL